MAKTACTKCGSSDGREVYDDGGSHCFVCSDHEFPEGSADAYQNVKPVVKTKGQPMLEGGVHTALRGITASTCRKYDYRVHTQYQGQSGVHSAPYANREGKIVAQHLRMPDKAMPFVGQAGKDQELQLFGQHLFPKGGKRLFICEGEIDTLSAYTALGESWPCVGLAGANRVEKIFKSNMEFIESFDTVVLCFDNDEAGRLATEKALEILSFGTHVLKDFPAGCKDVNDILTKTGMQQARTTLMFRTEEHLPDGIKSIADVEFKEEAFDVTLFPWDSFNKKLFARRSGEITVHTSGSGMGKSTITRQIVSNLMQQGETCGLIMLEESTEETKADLMSLHLNKPVRLIMAQRAINRKLEAKGLPHLYTDVVSLSLAELEEATKAVDASNLMILDHSKGYTVDSIVTQIRYLAVAKDVKHIVLDHITILVSSSKEIENEVKAVDVIMKELRMLAEELNISIDLVSHIRKKPSGSKSVNNGGDIQMEDLRGSGGLYQIANNVLAYNRDQHDEDRKNITTVRSLKARLGGYTGIVCELEFDPSTGLLNEIDSINNPFGDDKDKEDYG